MTTSELTTTLHAQQQNLRMILWHAQLQHIIRFSQKLTKIEQHRKYVKKDDKCKNKSQKCKG